MEKENFEKVHYFLPKSTLLRIRNFKLLTMNTKDVKVKMSIYQALTWFKSLCAYPGEYIPDMMVCKLDGGKKIFIDGDKEVVSVTIQIGKKREYWIGYLGDINAFEDNPIPLQDCFSGRVLGSKYTF